MVDIYPEPKPGTAFRVMLGEHIYLDEFVVILKRKIDLDRQYLNDLKALRSSWNPKWADTGIWPLISPLLEYCREEVVHREEACNEMEARLEKMPQALAPDTHDEGAAHPVEVLHQLEPLYRKYRQCEKVMVRPDTQEKLKSWYKSMKEETFLGSQRAQLRLPLQDREYRKAVVDQQREAARANEWYKDVLPDVLERHQQRAEDIKHLLQGVLNSYSALSSRLSASCTAAITSTASFASTFFIGPRHEEADQEASHQFLKKAVYCNYILDGQTSQPLFGVDYQATRELINHIFRSAKSVDWAYLPGPRVCAAQSAYITDVFTFEENTLAELSLALSRREQKEYKWIHMYAFYCDSPLIPLSKDHATRYNSEIIPDLQGQVFQNETLSETKQRIRNVV